MATWSIADPQTTAEHDRPLDIVIVALESPRCTCRWCRWWLRLLKQHLEATAGQEVLN